MTAATYAPARRAPRHQPDTRRERSAAHPTLRVVPRAHTRRAPRRRRLFLTVMTTVSFLCLIGVAAMQVVITQGQFELARLHRQAADNQARYDRLRLEVAELESPAVVVATAQRRLGMVPPPRVVYLAPPAARPGAGAANAVSPGTVTTRGTQDQASGPTDWSRLKPHLAER
ncbi:MAG TPA: hypothetical protein VM030_07240 [Acidimicrobiales bacterium]|nr:hypothetical protein [Acidimicrobiales bacterium]